MMDIETLTVAEIVTKDIKTADVFKKNGIDFCCGGNVAVREVCAKKGIDFEELRKDLIEVNTTDSLSHNFNDWELDFLVDYIVNTHHNYVAAANDLLIQYSDKVASVHGHHYSEVVEINKILHSMFDELNAHMQKEEVILFPYIKKIVVSKKQNIELKKPDFGTINNPIKMMEDEHDAAGDGMKSIATLSNNFTPPSEACNTFKALYAKLEEFQNDLFQHIHLENNILFPKAIELEKELFC